MFEQVNAYGTISVNDLDVFIYYILFLLHYILELYIESERKRRLFLKSMDCQLSVPVDKWQFNNNGLHIVNTRTKDFAHGHTMGNGQI